MSAAIAMNAPGATRNDSSPTLPPMLRGLLVSVMALLALVLCGRYALARLDQPVRRVAVTGAVRHVTAEAVRAVVAGGINGRLLQVDLLALRTAVEQLPWVANARVDRIWPDEIAVTLRERELFSRWGDHDALSTEGVVFEAAEKDLPSSLPTLFGPAGREQDVMAMYRDLSDRLTESPFAPKAVNLDARGDWSATTVSGVLLRFGRQQPLALIDRLKTAVLPALAGRLNQVARIDLRYGNGFAVAWREPSADAASPSNPSAQRGNDAPAKKRTAP